MKMRAICPTCHRIVERGQRCVCSPVQQMPEAERQRRYPTRAGYRTAAYKAARRAAIARATTRAGTVRCERCSTELHLKPRDTHAHHIDGDPMHNPRDGSNLVIVCHRCHLILEAERKREQG